MNRLTLILSLLLAILLGASMVAASTCTIPDNGTGTIDLPPNCFDGWQGMMYIINGLPPGSTIDITTQFSGFHNIDQFSGGILGGDIQVFQGTLHLVMDGSGDLAGFQRTIDLPALCEIHNAPRTAGDPVQTFASDVFFFATDNLVGDPDFGTLIIGAGSSLGMPSPGQTTITEVPGGDFAVDSFFDISYNINFTGAPGGMLDGLSGSTTDTQHFVMGELYVNAGCLLSDNGTGTIDLPPECPEGYEGHLRIVDGLPPGTTIEIEGVLTDFYNISRQLGGVLGGEMQQFNATMNMQMDGTGDLLGYYRQVTLPVLCEVHTAPRNPGDPVQIFTMDMQMMQGQLLGDPDFEELGIVAGGNAGLPSPGGTTIVVQPGGGFAVDSFFDITYEISFVGAPGSILEGLAGSSIGIEHFEMGGAALSPAGSKMIPGVITLQGNFPNPFNPYTEIMFDVPLGGAELSLAVFDLRGNKIRSLYSGWKQEGYAVESWDGTDDSGRMVASGIYYAAVDCRLVRAVCKMALIK